MSQANNVTCDACGELNPAYAFICAACKESLMSYTGLPTAEPPKTTEIPKEDSQPPSACLECLSQPEFVFQVQDGQTVGRRGQIDISPLEKSVYISGEHARFSHQGGRWLLEHLSRTNSTYVNGIKIQLGTPQELHDGDKITLANTAFLFRKIKV